MRFLLVLIAMSALLAPAVAHEGHDITVHAKETGCPEGKTYCYVVEGSLDGIEEGDEVTFTLVNDGSVEHELIAVPLGSADPAHQHTSEDDSLGEVPETLPGAQGSQTFTVPTGGLYLFCAIGDHEAKGMWLEVPTTGAPAAKTPFLGPLAIVGLVALAMRTRRA